jgi:UPF0755 protein
MMSIKDFGGRYRTAFLALLFFAVLVVSVPSLFVAYVEFKGNQKPSFEEEFPVTVDPRTKTIIEDERVNAYLQSDASPLLASALVAFSKLTEVLSSVITSFSNAAAGKGLALASEERIVRIAPGARKEEVAAAFTRTLGWDAQEKESFLTVDEGFLFPDTYIIGKDAPPSAVKALIGDRFRNNVLSRYGTTTAQIVPLATALTIASLIQKETIGTRDMRLVSGIIWNRLFAEHELQLDATLQYAKASKTQSGKWWPKVVPSDKFITSPYNTYQNEGLPPTPIGSPSVAAIVAALNPVKTDCFFYFHDKLGDIHCSPDYETHVTLLKQFFGRGK